mmetsp:Transcript_27982/g.64580  ORF Transcript_27982/g.64580 Transcript_27982/m.64580 type:complete len:485 (+) Transcript_27982:113-1567(+)
MISARSRSLIIFAVAASTTVVLIEWHAVHHIGLAQNDTVGFARPSVGRTAVRALKAIEGTLENIVEREIAPSPTAEVSRHDRNGTAVLSALRARAFGQPRSAGNRGQTSNSTGLKVEAETIASTLNIVGNSTLKGNLRGKRPQSQTTTAKVTVSFPPPPEVRHRACRHQAWENVRLPQVAMVIPYLNETWLHISSTVASILAYTPMDSVTEILFIDDGNSEGWMFHEELTALHPKVKVHRNKVRQGLIRAKVIGAHLTSSEVLVFMEPHCIVSREWLQPLLLTLVRGGHRTVVMPTLDIIPEENFAEYHPANYHIGGFDWSMTFNWMAVVTERNHSYVLPEPFPTPALSGGIFGIWRDFWHDSGEYDVNMTEWGGEHIEMSLRTWRCGGQIFAVPCSRIGHVFRQRNPYVVHQKEVIKNQKRAAAVWLDEHLEDFYKEVPYARHLDAGDITERLQLKERLQCKSMEWYVDNVYPELKTKQPRKR